MWQRSAHIFYTIARDVVGIFEAASLCLRVLIAGLIFIAACYRSLGRIIVASTADPLPIGDSTDEDGRS